MWVYSINVLRIQAGKGTGDDRHLQHGVSEYLVSSFDGFRVNHLPLVCPYRTASRIVTTPYFAAFSQGNKTFLCVQQAVDGFC